MSTKKIQIIGGNFGSNIVIDDTLTEVGQAADAKVTGDAINQLQANIDEVAGLVGGFGDEYYTETEIDSMIDDLNATIDSKSNFGHTHDDSYYTETEIDNKLDSMQSDIDSKVNVVDGMGLSTNDYTTAEKDKLSTIEANANFYEHPVHTSHSSGLYKVTVDESGHVSGATLAEKEDIVALGIPAQDTTYEEEIEGLSGRLDDVENDIDVIINETLNDLSGEFENYKETNNEAVSTNASGIEANKTAIEEIQSDYLTSENQQLLQDGINEVSDKATANAAAIEKLNGDEYTEGSVKQSINTAFNEFAANLTNNDVIDTYKELIDYAAKHAPEFDNLVAEVGGIDSRVGGIDSRVGTIEADLPGYKETVTSRFDGIDQAIEGYINDTQEALEGKADLEHEHNDLYYTKDEILESITVDDIDDICGSNQIPDGDFDFITGCFVAQSEAPSDTSVLWLDTDDNSTDSGGNVDLTGYAKEQWVEEKYQPKGDYLTEEDYPEIAEYVIEHLPRYSGEVVPV